MPARLGCWLHVCPLLFRNSVKILDDWKVYVGSSDLRQRTEGISVSRIIINTNYSDDQDDYDIALMKLSRPLTLSGEALPAARCLGLQGLGFCLAPGKGGHRLDASPRSSALARSHCCFPAANIRPACLPMYGQKFLTSRSCFITGFGKIKETEGERCPAGWPSRGAVASAAAAPGAQGKAPGGTHVRRVGGRGEAQTFLLARGSPCFLAVPAGWSHQQPGP